MDSPLRPVPTGVAVRLDGAVVARGGHVNPGLIRDGVVSVVDPDSREVVSVPAAGAEVVSTVTNGWLFGHEVSIAAGSSTRYVLRGYVWDGTAPPRGVEHVADDGSFSLATDELGDVVAIDSVSDTLLHDGSTARARAGALVATPGRGADQFGPAASLECVPLPDAGSGPAVQHPDGSVTALAPGLTRRWIHGLGTAAGREVEILAEREGRLWVASRRSRTGADGLAYVRLLGGIASRYLGWVPTGEVDGPLLFSRAWTTTDELPLLQGHYGRVEGLLRSLAGSDGGHGPRPSRASGWTTVHGASPVPVDDEDYAWSLSGGARSVPDGDVLDRVSVRTTAWLAGTEVELVRPWDPMTDGRVLLVRGAGDPGPQVLLSDGFTVVPRPAAGGGWTAQVRRDHLDGVESTVVDEG